MKYRWFTANRCKDPCGCKWELRQAVYPGAPAEWVAAEWVASFACPDHPFSVEDIELALTVEAATL